MVNPTGYTALDMIGFTDKGTYSSSDNYVKNDLVHYSGNIWRCLIDDTSGVEPAEGVNWTLFIGEPTNLVERIIAPVETDPATSAWAVGRQIIYNDNLYEVITAITAGDALVAYEDDPTNANIKLADPVETQVLAQKTQILTLTQKAYQTDDATETALASDDLVPFYDTSATAKKKMSVANLIGQTVSNPNLLDNPWFTVNQRGISSLSAVGYTADRWKIYATGLTFTQNSNKSITLERGASEAVTSPQFIQFIEDEVLAFLDGKTVTLSALINGVVYSATSVIDASQNTFACNISIATGISLYIRIIPTGNPKAFVCFNLSGTSAMTLSNIKAVKLELGTVSTLAQDTAPNYAEELAKCQRYYQRINTRANVTFGLALAVSATLAIMPITINTMRALPSVGEDVTGMSLKTADDATSNAITAINGYFEGDVAHGVLTLTSTSLVVGTIYKVEFANSTSYIDFSADL